MNIGILTGGGDCPGLNAVIRSVVKLADKHGDKVFGFKNGWKGVIDGNYTNLERQDVTNIIQLGGTILGTSRTNLRKEPNGFKKAISMLKTLNIEALIAIGGEDTLGIANDMVNLPENERYANVIGCPKTIDNDLNNTDFTFGFDTAVTIATEAIDRLHSTAESHSRVMILEVMGRDTGWIAIYAGMASGADVIVIPEFPLTITEIISLINRRHQNLEKTYSIVVIAEGISVDELLGDEAKDFIKSKDEPVIDSFGHEQYGGISHLLAKEIQSRTGIDARAIVLGYVQRGGTPTARDRFLATSFGIEAYKNAKAGNFGTMMALHGTKIVPIKLSDAISELKRVPIELYNQCKQFFG
ncbi:MAG: 6-phosphofructokinase [Planctomycetes bacterium]|nr:6-phosphofructokinase [Planctomycetota bacterium]